MRSLKSRLFGFGVAAFFGTLVVVGCTASGEDPGTEIDGTEPDEAGGGKVIDQGDDDDDDSADKPDAAKKDAGKKDAGKDASKDAAADAGPTAPETGDKCPTIDTIFKRSCGTCGTQEALCIANTKGTGNVVDEYGTCKGEKAGGCVPGTTEDVACGNCGTQKRTCNKYCEWTTGGCTGQPTNACSPGSVELTSASCSSNTYRQRTCQGTCTWNNFTTTCAPPPTSITVPAVAGATNSTILVLEASKTLTKLSTGTCPVSSLGSATPYAYIEVRNNNPKQATISIYNSQANGGQIIDTVMTAYDGATPPASNNDTARKACRGKVNDYGTAALTGNTSFASLDQITIPANSSLTIYTATYYPYDATQPTKTTGMLMLNVKTESVAP